MANAVEDICNQALRAVGYSRMIAWVYEGSVASRVALEIYRQTRDELLRSGEWPFARGPLALTLLKGPPPPGGFTPLLPWSTVYPPPGWLYEYAYPADCLELLAIVPAPSAMPVLLPQAATFRADNDLAPVVSTGPPPSAAGPPQRVILTNQVGAVAIYRRRVTNPALWEPGFTASLIERLAAKFADSPQLAASPELRQALPQEAAATAAMAGAHRG